MLSDIVYSYYFLIMFSILFLFFLDELIAFPSFCASAKTSASLARAICTRWLKCCSRS